MLVLSSLLALSILTVLVPMIICTAGTIIARPIATSKAMEVFPENAGTSARRHRPETHWFSSAVDTCRSEHARDGR